MTKELAIRASQLPLAFICGQSCKSVGIAISNAGEPADVGSCVHRVLSPVVEGMPLDSALDTAFAEFADVDQKEVEILVSCGVRMWPDILAHMRGMAITTETSYQATIGEGDVTVSLSGHIDVLGIDSIARRAVVADWKSGRLDANYKHQGIGYAVLALLNNPDIDEVLVLFAWLRAGEIEPYTVTRATMQDWLEQFMNNVVKSETFHLGPHCGHCHRNHDCDGFKSMARRDVAMFTDGAQTDLTKMDEPELCIYQRRLKYLEGLLKEAKETARSEITRRGGSIEDGNGSVIHFVEQGSGREVDYSKAMPIISELLNENEYAPCIAISIKQVEDTLAKKAGKGNGAKAKRALTEKLEAVNAVEKKTTMKLIDERKR